MLDDLLGTTTSQCIHFRVKEPNPRPLIAMGMKIFTLDSSGVRNKKSFLSQISIAMEFPEYFGNNWDALEECLRDLTWAPASGYVLIIRNAQLLWQHHTELAGKLVESWLFAAAEWSKVNTPFHLLFLL